MPEVTETADVRDFIVAGVEAYGIKELWAVVIALRIARNLPPGEAKEFLLEGEQGRLLLGLKHQCMRPPGHTGGCVCHCGSVSEVNCHE